MDFLAKLGSIILTPVIAISGFFGDLFHKPVDAPMYDGTEEPLGRAVNPVAGKTYSLYGGGIGSSDPSITLTSFTIPVSNALYNMTHFGTGVNAIGYLTIEPGSATKQEFISFTGITQNSDGTATLTGVSRGLAPVYPYTASTTYAKSHTGGSVVVISNPPQLYEAIYSYIDNATTSGAVDAASSIKGIVEVATGLEAASTTQIGGGNTTAPLVITTLISTSTAPSSGNVIPVTRSDGNIDIGFLPDLFGSTTIRYYTASTTYTRPATSTGLKAIIVEVQGAGGDGSADGTGGDSGGAGGGYVKSIFSFSQIATTTTITIGGPGVGTGNTSFGNIMIAGNGADASGASGASGGTATGGNILNVDGQSTIAQTSFFGGDGGDSVLGKGGQGGPIGQDATSAGGSAQSGFGFGSGGGGAGAATDGSPQGNSSTGKGGVVIITEIY